MIKIENTEVFNLEGAIRGLRNPLKSWHKSDSKYNENGEYEVGIEDYSLALRLISAGSGDRKFLQHILVSCSIKAPIYFFTEFDTYRVTPAHPNSTSTMHTLAKDGFSEDTIQFSKKEEFKEEWENYLAFGNKILDKYIETKDVSYLVTMKEILGGGFYYEKEVVLNYENLRNMYRQRKNHRLPEWRQFCRWIEELPYSAFVTD